MAIITWFSRHPEILSKDAQDISAACKALQVREFKFFGLAYCRWFGREATEKCLEPLFVRYLYSEQAPIWVRHFSREVLRREGQGVLDRTDFGLPAKTSESTGHSPLLFIGRLVFFGAWVVMVATIVIGLMR